MYSYTWDSETGGLLLNSSPLHFSKEPRPVYSTELDILGFDKFWDYDKDDSIPIMWAEANNYIYRGRTVATTKGGGAIGMKPEINIIDEAEPNNMRLRPVDVKLMVSKNAEMVDILTQITLKKIYASYEQYRRKRVDVFYVAFSGGKDSIVTLDLVQKALPHNSFKVLFGDTGMEFPDTYETVDFIEKYCYDLDISFVRAKSNYTPLQTWGKFGPPATVNRWCCSVHKTSPQVLALREITGIQDFTGMAFIGVRANESAARSSYEYISLGEKHKGQYSCNPILEWNSAELYLYIYSEKLYINKAYKKGNRRVGCLLCPRAAERSEYICQLCYPTEFQSLLDLIKGAYVDHFASEEALNQFVVKGGWKARKNGRDLTIGSNYEEIIDKDSIKLIIKNPRTDWRQWIKTIGVLQCDTSPFLIDFRGDSFSFEVVEENDTITVSIDPELTRTVPNFVKLIKNVFRKAAFCIGCRTCEADCHHGALHMTNGQILIDDKCSHCSLCHKVEKGCLVYKSLEKPKGTNMNAKTKSLNCYLHFAPKMDWITQFFKFKEDLSSHHTLGSVMYDFFKRFLKDADLMNNNILGKTAVSIERIGIENENSWALMLVNLVYSPQFNWHATHLNFYETYSKEYVMHQLVNDGAKESWVADIWSSFTRFSDLPFPKVGYGVIHKEGNRAVSIVRTPWTTPDPKVILYSLYKFAEACGDYYQFSLSTLYDENVDSDGVSPARIFGIEKEEMKKILIGLSSNHDEFISTTFTFDLDNINLKDDKTSQDVLDLF